MRGESLATWCEGAPEPFRLIEQQMVIGQRVGDIDEAVPQMPLAADLARQQRKLKLKAATAWCQRINDLPAELRPGLLSHYVLLAEAGA